MEKFKVHTIGQLIYLIPELGEYEIHTTKIHQGNIGGIIEIIENKNPYKEYYFWGVAYHYFIFKVKPKSFIKFYFSGWTLYVFRFLSKSLALVSLVCFLFSWAYIISDILSCIVFDISYQFHNVFRMIGYCFFTLVFGLIYYYLKATAESKISRILTQIK